MRAEPLYDALNPLSSEVFAVLFRFPKSEPLNRKFQKFRDESQMERTLPEKKNFENLGIPLEVVLFSGKLSKFVILYSGLVFWQRSPRVGHPRLR